MSIPCSIRNIAATTIARGTAGLSSHHSARPVSELRMISPSGSSSASGQRRAELAQHRDVGRALAASQLALQILDLGVAGDVLKQQTR